jgi:hypothetical protein
MNPFVRSAGILLLGIGLMFLIVTVLGTSASLIAR